MTKEKLFEFVREKGWHEILEVAHDIHSLSGIAGRLNKKESHLEIELRAMQAMGLMGLARKKRGGFVCIPTVLGIKFMQEQSKKSGRTFSCLLCGTITGFPHICPAFYPEFLE